MSEDKLVTAGMLADRLRPIVLGGESACLDGTPVIPLHRGTVTAIYQHLERLAGLDGETTIGALEHALARHDQRETERRTELEAKLAAKRKVVGSNSHVTD